MGASINELVGRFAKDREAVEILRELHKLRPAMMVGEFLDKLKIFDHPAYREVTASPKREPRALANHPDNPARAPSG